MVVATADSLSEHRGRSGALGKGKTKPLSFGEAGSCEELASLATKDLISGTRQKFLNDVFEHVSMHLEPCVLAATGRRDGDAEKATLPDPGAWYLQKSQDEPRELRTTSLSKPPSLRMSSALGKEPEQRPRLWPGCA